MSRKVTKIRALDPIERDFLGAFDRLVRGEPTNPDLRQLAMKGKLKVNTVAVAKEAGRTRRLIYQYPKVLELLGGKREQKEANGLDQVIARLREDKQALRAERDLALAQNAAFIIRLKQLGEEAQREIRKAKRESDGRLDPNQIAGNVTSLFAKR